MAQKRATNKKKSTTKKKTKKQQQQQERLNYMFLGLIFILFGVFGLFRLGFLGTLLANCLRLVVGNTFPFVAILLILYGLLVMIYGKDFIYTKNIERFSDIVSMYLKKIIRN